MEIKDLTKEELQKATEIYIKERETCTWLCSLEEFTKCFIRRCDECMELVTVENDDDVLNYLPANNVDYWVCNKCYEELSD